MSHDARPRYVLRANVRKRLAPLEGTPGRSVYEAGGARFELDAETITVRPAFPLSHEATYDFVQVEPLLEALARDYLVGVILVRLGGYAVGVFSGERLVASKVGHRYVQGRHRAGGSSANRFRRRREEQARTLHAAAGETAMRVLAPYMKRLDAVAFGGDRTAVRNAIAAHPGTAGLQAKELDRFFTVPDPRRAVLERVIHDVYAAQVVVDRAPET